MLAEDATLLEDAERSQIPGSKYKKVSLGDDVDCWSSKKAKEKQLARYCGDIRVKMGDINPYERCVHAEQDYLVHNFR